MLPTDEHAMTTELMSQSKERESSEPQPPMENERGKEFLESLRLAKAEGKRCSSCCNQMPLGAFDEGVKTCRNCLHRKRTKAAQERREMGQQGVLRDGVKALHTENTQLRAIINQLTQQSQLLAARVAQLEMSVLQSGIELPMLQSGLADGTYYPAGDMPLHCSLGAGPERYVVLPDNGGATIALADADNGGASAALPQDVLLELGNELVGASLPGVGQGSGTGAANYAGVHDHHGTVPDADTQLEDGTLSMSWTIARLFQPRALLLKSLVQQYWAPLVVAVVFLTSHPSSLFSVGPVTLVVVWFSSALAMVFHTQIDDAMSSPPKRRSFNARQDAFVSSLRKWTTICSPVALLWRLQLGHYWIAAALAMFSALACTLSTREQLRWVSRFGLVVQIVGALYIQMEPEAKSKGLMLQNATLLVLLFTRGVICLWLSGPTETVAESSALTVTGLLMSSDDVTKSLLTMIWSVSISAKLIQYTFTSTSQSRGTYAMLPAPRERQAEHSNGAC